jgi:purine-binding chemotaxis protein CheW
MYRFEMPHRRIHTIADAVLKYAEQGEHDKAREIISHTEQGDLRNVVNLFAEARTAFRESHKEVAVVLTDGRKHVSLTLDNVASVEAIPEDTIADAATAMDSVRSDLIKKVAHRANGKGIVFLLDAEALLAGHC